MAALRISLTALRWRNFTGFNPASAFAAPGLFVGLPGQRDRRKAPARGHADEGQRTRTSELAGTEARRHELDGQPVVPGYCRSRAPQARRSPRRGFSFAAAPLHNVVGLPQS